MTKIIGISGKKQSGKNTASNFLVGMTMKGLGIISDFSLNSKGELVVPVQFENEVRQEVFNPQSRNSGHVEWCQQSLWPYIKVYSFADLLKNNVCIDILGLTEQQCYGTDEDKNTLTKLLWEDMPGWKPLMPCGAMTAREVMQYVGTEIFRKMYGDVWAEGTIRQIQKDSPDVAVLNDTRFPNEISAIQTAGGKIIRLTRNVTGADEHASEKSLDPQNFDWSKFDYVLDNHHMSIQEQNMGFGAILEDMGIINVLEEVPDSV